MKRAEGRFVNSLNRVTPKTHRRRWRGRKGQIYEEDTQHGDLEKYNKNGMHKGSVDPDTGDIIKMPVKGRTTAM